MKLLNILLTIMLFVTTSVYGQWTYKSGKTDFDGKYKTSSVRGRGGKFPYSSPLFVVNKFENNSVNFYITDAGYSGCSNKSIYLKFDGDETIYKTKNVYSGKNNESWFLDGIYSLSDMQFVEKLKTHAIVSVRISSSCGQEDYKFSLKGSSAALNFVLGIDWEKKEVEKDSLNKLKIKLENKRKRIKDSLWRVKIEFKRKAIRKKDSLLKVALYNSFVKKCSEASEYVEEYSAKCYMYNEKGKFYTNLRDFESTKVKEGKILFIDLSFKNKMFYKVIFIEELGKINVFSPKNTVLEPSL